MASLDTKQRVCSVCIDEMSVKTYLHYDIRKDEIVGFHDGVGKQKMPAQSVMVVMARGLYAKWKQPLAFFFRSIIFKVNN